MISPAISAKLEQDTARLKQANTRITTARRELQRAESEHASGNQQGWWILAAFFGLVVLGHLHIIFSILGMVLVFGALGLHGLGLGPFYDEKAGQAKIDSITSKVRNINSEIETIENSIGNINAAMEAEENLDYRKAIDLFDRVGLNAEARRIRKTMREEGKVKVDQTVVHGDYVDDRDTIVKDSVVSKSNIGAGGDDKLGKIKELKELLDSGAIDAAEFKQMKKEILGK